jgi:hypothetical protein
MTKSNPELNIPPQPTQELAKPEMSLARLLLVSVVLLPSSAVLVSWMLILVTNNLDVAYALGVSDTFLTGLVIAAAGLVTGTVVALIGGKRGRALLVPPVAGSLVGAGIYIGFVAFERGDMLELGGLGLVTIGVGQVLGVVASTRIAVGALTGVVVAVMGMGVASASLIQAIPDPPAEVLFVLDVYTVEEETGECAGAGELASVVEGSEVLLLELPEVSGRPTEVGSVVLPEGFERGGGCVFELGNPLRLPVAGYERIDFLPESDPGVPYGISLEGNRVIVNLQRAER